MTTRPRTRIHTAVSQQQWIQCFNGAANDNAKCVVAHVFRANPDAAFAQFIADFGSETAIRVVKVDANRGRGLVSRLGIGDLPVFRYVSVSDGDVWSGRNFSISEKDQLEEELLQLLGADVRSDIVSSSITAGRATREQMEKDKERQREALLSEKQRRRRLIVKTGRTISIVMYSFVALLSFLVLFRKLLPSVVSDNLPF